MTFRRGVGWVGREGRVERVPVTAAEFDLAGAVSGGRLTLVGRSFIQFGLMERWSVRAIALRLGVAPSTVSREIHRVGLPAGKPYHALAAHKLAVAARSRVGCRQPKLAPGSVLRSTVVGLLAQGLSPQQVAGRLRSDHPGRHDGQVSHESIYQALYVQTKGSLRHELDAAIAAGGSSGTDNAGAGPTPGAGAREVTAAPGLSDRVASGLERPEGRALRTSRAPRSKLPRRSNRPWLDGFRLADRVTRFGDLHGRSVPGHWEGDLIIGPDTSGLITLVERSSRFTLIGRLPGNRETVTVTDRLTAMIQSLPADLFRSLTWDQGAEMARHAAFTIATGCPVFFCDPHSPWQRPSNENHNRLIREYLPKGTNFNTVTDTHTEQIARSLNTRPRKVLNYRTPAERLLELFGVALTL